MAKAFKCDRCGKFVEGTDQIKLTHMDTGSKWPMITNLELCYECGNEFYKFLGAGAIKTEKVEKYE